MIVKNYESKKIDIKLNKFFLLNGDNDGAKEDFIKSILKEKYVNSEIYFENEILNNLENFYSSISTKSFFDDEKIIIIKKSTNKILNLVEEIREKSFKDLILILNADLLDKKSKLRNFFEKEKETICVAFYADTHQTLNIIANNFLRDIKLSLSQQSINLIIEKSNGSRQHLQNELEKINSLSLTNKKIEINQIMKITNLGNQNTISELIDLCLIKNKVKMIKMLNENNFTGDDSILILRSLLNKTKRLFNLSKSYQVNRSIDSLVLSYKPTIFWKEKDLVKQQIKIWSLINIKKLISQISTIEQLVKQTPLQSKNILSDFLLKISAKTNSRI
jgi:DNA polymerase III subunit delta